MRSLLPKKEKYYKEYADNVYKAYRQLRYGLASCPGITDPMLTDMRKQIVDWQSIEDEDALCQPNVNYTTWFPVNYRNDNQVQFDTSGDVWGPGYSRGINPNAPVSVGAGFTYGQGSHNIIEVNTGGCITRINLNPAVIINQNSSFQFTQQTPSTVWTIQHNMGINPNVSTEDLQGNDIQGIIEYVDVNNLKIYFNQPTSGVAYLS